jgi:regulator of sigma E protease
MIILKILLGLVGLGFVILIHELGHFLGARLTGITVERFSIGWGKRLFTWKGKKTEYCLSLLPIGGYCKMKGDEMFKQAIDQNLENIPYEKGAYYSASPLRRIITVIMGPAFSLLFPVLILACVWYFGFTVQTQGNRIILAADYSFSGDMNKPTAAQRAGLKTGDRIVAIDGIRTDTGADVQENIAPYAKETKSLTVERDGSDLTVSLTPELDAKTGAGRIGVYFWTDPVIASVAPNSAAYLAGFRAGDRIVQVNGKPVANTVDLAAALDSKPQTVSMRINRGGVESDANLVLTYSETNESNLGIAFKSFEYRTPRYTIPGAVAKGWNEMEKTLVLSVRSIALLFKGVDATQAISGPVRTTVIVGDVAIQGFSAGFGQGLSVIFNFLSVLSIAIFLTQMLPIPALDGGQTLLFIIELVSRRRLKTKFVYYFQMVGTVLVVGLMFFALFGDVLYLFNK